MTVTAASEGAGATGHEPGGRGAGEALPRARPIRVSTGNCSGLGDREMFLSANAHDDTEGCFREQDTNKDPLIWC